jgi:prevent-host-death family protein
MPAKPRRARKRSLLGDSSLPGEPAELGGASEVRDAEATRAGDGRAALEELGRRSSDTVRATDAKNEFGRLLDRALGGRHIVITKHDTPAAVLMSFDEYRRLAPDEAPDLGALSREFDELLARMQSAPARRATKALFAASPSALAKAAVAEARRKARPRKRG